MNKKFSTLVAMLLASGGLFYAVDAMVLPASEGVAKTLVAVATKTNAQGTVVGYKMELADVANFSANWTVKTLTKGSATYLTVKDATGTWYLANDLTVKAAAVDVEPTDALVITIEAETNLIQGGGKYLFIDASGLSLGNTGNASLANAEKAIVSSATGDVAIVAVETKTAIGSNDVQWAAATPATALVGADGTNMALEKGESEDGNFYLKLGEDAYLTCTEGGELSISAAKPSNDANSAISFGEDSDNEYLKIGDKALVKNDATGAVLGFKTGDNGSDGDFFYMAETKNIKDDAQTTIIKTAEAKTAAKVFNVAKEAITSGVTGSVFLNFVPAKEAEVKAATVGESFDAKEKWTISGNTLKAADGAFLTVDGSEASLANEGTELTLEAKTGAVMAGGKYVVNSDGIKTADSGTKLYLFDDAKNIVTSLTEDAIVVLAEGTSKTEAVSFIKTTAVTQVADAPGVDVPGMDEAGVSVDENGKITVPTGSVSDIPAPHTISIDNKFLSVKDGAVVYLSGEDAANATSWILKDGKYMSVEMAKLGKANAWLGNAPAQKAVQPTTYALVTKGAAIDAKATSAGVTLGNTPIAATLTTTGTAVPVDVTLNADSKLNSVSNGAVVILGNGTSAFIKNANGEVTDDINQAALWVVNMSARADGSYNYSFKQKDTENYLTVGTAKDFVAEKYEGGFALKATGGYVTIPASGSASLDVNSVSSVLYGVPVSTKPFTAKEILSDHGTLTSFNLSLWDEKDGVSNLVQNPFEDADLVPVYYYNGTFTPITADNADKLSNPTPSTFLLKKGDSYIVAETTKDSEWSNINTELIAGGFKFVTLSEKAMAEVMTNAGKWKEGTYAPYFTFNYNKNAVENGVATAKTPIYSINVAAVNKASVGNVSTFTIKTNTESATYLTTSSKSDYWVYAEFSANNAVRGDSDKDYNPLNMKYVNITFVNHSSITWNNIKLDGKVLGAEAKPADAANFLFSKPEGQWAVKMTAATGDLSKGKELGDDVYRFTFKNRESGETYDVNKLFYLGNNKYAVSYSNTYDKFAQNAGTLRDTIAITPVEGLKNNTRQFDGYKNMTAQEVQDQLFNLLVASAEEDYYVGENHTAKSHFLGLSHSEEAAVNWRIVPLTAARTYDANKDLTQASDSVYVFNNPQYYKASDKKFYQYNDTVAIISYALQNVANDEFLTYENPQTTDILSMICDPNFKSYKTTKNISDAHRFVLKEKGTDLYNIIAVDYPEYDTKGEFVAEGENAWASLNLDRKLYGATTLTKQGAVEVEGAYKQINSNDVFKVQMVGAPEYRLMNMGDTIRIFRQENEYDQMFEKGEFLNIGNKAQLTDMAPALYVDTAYVKRGHNNRYQYLLVVNPNYVPAEPCNIPGHPTVHPDTTYGRFLVNLIDTANVAYQNGAIHANKYINDTEAGEKFAKLGFVYGFRTADKLYITDKNFQKSGKASDVIDLSTRDFNVAKFAFRYINPINHESDGSFKIQTGYYHYNSYIATNKQPEVENNGYLKNINGVMVVAKGYEAGDKFDLAIEHSDPTANDAISANGVSVAAIDGAVIVKGAAGKTVVITNILGQTIANAVLSSDNETIAAPAGVVVVAVEGEAAVKAIVK